MKNKLIFPLIMSSLLLVGCNNSEATTTVEPATNPTNTIPAPTTSVVPTGSTSTSTSEEPVVPKRSGKVTVNMPSEFLSDVENYPITVDFDDAYFENSSKTFNKDLSMLSLANSFAVTTKQEAHDFYRTVTFDKIVSNDDYDIEPTEDTVAFTMAHKPIGEYHLFSLSVRAFEYKKEWVNNLKIGSEGDHEGFTARANYLYEQLLDFISEYDTNNIKIWLNGYSRGGSLTNMVGAKLMQNIETLNFDENNLFVYTFEAPRCLSLEHAVEYENIHNIVNEYDLIAKIAPEEYGLYRCGIDHILQTEGVDNYLTELNPNIDLPDYVTESEDVPNEGALGDEIIKGIIKEAPEEDKDKSAETRELFAEHYQGAIGYALGMYFSLKQETVDAIKDKFSSLSTMEMFALIGEDGFYNFLEPFVRQDGVSYVDSELKENLNTLQTFLLYRGLTIVGSLLSENGKNNMSRLIGMHYPETTYVLLKNA